PKKRFTVHPNPLGGMCYEHLISTEQVLAESTLLYRLRSPSRVIRTETTRLHQFEAGEALGGRPMLLRPLDVESAGDFVTARVAIAFNDDLVASIARPTASMTNFYC